MAASKKYAQKGDSEFLTWSLDKKQTAALKAMSFEVSDFDSAMIRLHEEGYKVTFREDVRNNCYACWLLPIPPNHLNEGFILTGRGSSPVKALKQAAYIHWQLWETEWAKHSVGVQNNELDD